MILYINSCVRKGSRTDRIARALLEKLGGEYAEVDIYKSKLSPLSEETLEKRNALVEKRDYSDPMFDLAKQFAQADEIVVSAPYWDLSFPSALKVYFENIYCIGIVTEYGAEGIPHGLCRAKTLYYVATAGGQFLPDFGYDYVKALAVSCFGIKRTELIKAEMLDIEGSDAEKAVESVINGLKKQ